MCPINRLDEAFSLSPDFLSKMHLQRDFGEASSEKAGRSNRSPRRNFSREVLPTQAKGRLEWGTWKS